MKRGQMAETTFKESFKVAGHQLVDAVKTLLHEGNVRRIVIKQDGRTVVEFPMTVGVVGTVYARGRAHGRRGLDERQFKKRRGVAASDPAWIGR
jgi:hypothetical protein